MTVSLGIAVGADRLRAVAVRGDAAVWAAEVELPPGRSIAAALADALTGAPLPRWPRPRAVVALGPSRAQTRCIAGLPPVGDARVLAQIVREGASRFFLANGKPLATTGVRLEEPGRVWCAAFEEPTVHAVVSACAGAGLRLRAIVPAVAVLPLALEDPVLTWRDGGTSAEVRADGGVMRSVRRLVADDDGEPAAGSTRPAPGLAPLGPEAWRFADAYGAAVLPGDEALVLRPGRAGAAGHVPGWRLGLAGAALAVSVAGALYLPVAAARGAGEEANARVDSLAAPRRAALVADAELRRVTAGLAQVAEFDAARRPAATLLAELTRALPDGAALVALRIDSAGGGLVAVAPRAAAVLMPLERVDGVRAPEVVGPVTREVLAGREVERVTVKFGLDSVPAPHREAKEVASPDAPGAASPGGGGDR
jgi:hypothetical protein